MEGDGDKTVGKFRPEISSLAWTLGGTALVLITLSGETLKWGLWITGLSLTLYTLGVLVQKDED